MRDKILETLRERIVQVELKPGDPLNEKKLAEEFSVSRTPIREVLFLLQTEGLATITRNRGAMVSDINLSYYKELVEFRLLLERGAARLASQNATAKQMNELEKLKKRIESSSPENIDELTACDRIFHRIVRDATNNNLLKQQMAIIHNQFTRVAKLISYKSVNSLSDVDKLIEALKNKDSKRIEKILETHIRVFFKAMAH